MSWSIGGILRSAHQALSGQNLEADAESGAARQDLEGRREAGAAAPAAASSSQAGPAGQERRAQRSLSERLAAASQTPLPSAAGHEQQEVEQELPASLTVTVCNREGPLSATFNLQHVQDLLPLLSGQDVYRQLLGGEGGITAAHFYAACVTSVMSRGRNCGFGFLLDEPAPHRLLRLELLAARAGLMLEDEGHPIAHSKTDAVLSDGAAKLFGHLWQHDRGSRAQGVLCDELVCGYRDRPGASPGSLENVLRKAYKDEYNQLPSKAPRNVLRPLAADQLQWQQRPLEELSLLFDDNNAQNFEQPQQEQQEQGQLAQQQGAPFVPVVGIELILALQAQVQALEEEVHRLRRRVQLLEVAAPLPVL